MAIIDTLNEGIKEAIRSRNSLRLETFRMLKARILAADARAQLPDEEVIKLFKSYLGNLEEAFEISTKANRAADAEKLKGEIEIVKEFLPKMLSEAETRQLVLGAIEETKAGSAKDLGLVMKCIMKQNLPVDSKLVRELATVLLQNLAR
jgi:uncharacterized protein YqeY